MKLPLEPSCPSVCQSVRPLSYHASIGALVLKKVVDGFALFNLLLPNHSKILARYAPAHMAMHSPPPTTITRHIAETLVTLRPPLQQIIAASLAKDLIIALR